MKLPNRPYSSPVSSDPVNRDDLTLALNNIWEQIVRAVNGKIWFGSVANGPDNIDGTTLEQADTGAANTAFSLTHNLGRIPVGFIVVYADLATSIYDGGVAWTSTTISLKSSTANVHLRVFVF